MRVVVAGSAGFVGRALVRSLVDDGHDVVLLSRHPRRARTPLPRGARMEAWDPARSGAGLPLVLANATAVVNLHGARGSAFSRALVEAMAALPPSERPAAFIDVCHDPEREALARRAEKLHVRVVVLRLGLVVGRGGGPALGRLALLVRGGAGGRIGAADQRSLSWIALEDAVGLMRRAITGWDIIGPFELAAPRAIGDGRMAPTKALAASYEFLQPDLEQALERALRGSPMPSAKVAWPCLT